MIIAKVDNGTVLEVADCSAMFPNTSFPSGGPTEDWMIENSCMYINNWLPYDQSTEQLVSVPPYIQSEDETHWVYTVEVQPLTPEQIAQREEAAKQANKQQASKLLYETDWTTIPDVSDPTLSDPYLLNASEFVAYRSSLRKIAVNPPVTVNEWPVKPEEQWSSV